MSATGKVLRISLNSRAEPLTVAAVPARDDERHWALCHAYVTLRTQIDRYARGEILGQSILLAGHRGSGKTTLTHLAIQQVKWLAEGLVEPRNSFMNVSISGEWAHSSNTRLVGDAKFEDGEQDHIEFRLERSSDGVRSLIATGLGSLPSGDEVRLTEFQENGSAVFRGKSRVKRSHLRKTKVTGHLHAISRSHPTGKKWRIAVSLSIDWENAQSIQIEIPNDLLSTHVDDLVVSGRLEFTLFRPYAAIPFLVPLHGPDLFLSSINPTDDEGRSLAEGAMAQIRKAIHRALSEEIAHRYCQCAAASGDDELSEAATQLRVELDSAPQVSLLKMYWDRAGLLSGGVLQNFRRNAGRISRNNDSHQQTQGLREVLALHTATESIKSTDRRGESPALPRSEEPHSGEHTTPELDLKLPPAKLQEAVLLAAPIMSLLAGAFAAHAVIETLGPITAGAVAIITVLLAYSFLSRTISSTSDATLTGDPSLGSQDLLLPVLVQRSVEAGFAPIFVVDELDKIQGDLNIKLEALMKRLKYFVTDRAFFCFIADRSYYEEFQRQVQSTAYPIQDTYYADRLLIHHSHRELHRFLNGVLARPGSGQTVGDRVSRELLPFLILSQSNAHLGALSRVLKENSEGEGVSVSGGGRALWTSAGYRLATTIQVAVECVCDDSIVAARLQQEPHFTQWLYDALYYFPRKWRKDHSLVVYSLESRASQATVESISAILKERLPTSGTASRANPEWGTNQINLDERDEQFLCGRMDQLARYLTRPDDLIFNLLFKTRSDPPGGLKRVKPSVLALILESLPLLTRIETEGVPEYHWAFDQYGRRVDYEFASNDCDRWLGAVTGDHSDQALKIRFADISALNDFLRVYLATSLSELLNAMRGFPKSDAVRKFWSELEDTTSQEMDDWQTWLPTANTFEELVTAMTSDTVAQKTFHLIALECLLRTEWPEVLRLLSVAAAVRAADMTARINLKDLLVSQKESGLTSTDWATRAVDKYAGKRINNDLVLFGRVFNQMAIAFLGRLAGRPSKPIPITT